MPRGVDNHHAFAQPLDEDVGAARVERRNLQRHVQPCAPLVHGEPLHRQPFGNQRPLREQADHAQHRLRVFGDHDVETLGQAATRSTPLISRSAVRSATSAGDRRPAAASSSSAATRGPICATRATT